MLSAAQPRVSGVLPHPEVSSALIRFLRRDLFVVPHHLADDEGDELLRELRVQFGFDGQGTQPLDLLRLTVRVGRRTPRGGLQLSQLMGDLETLGQQMDQHGIHVVDAAPQPQQFPAGVLGFHQCTITSIRWKDLMSV